MGRRAVALWGTSVLQVFIVIAALAASGSVEDQLETDGSAALAADGITGVEVEADGRDLVVGSDTPSEVVQLLESVDGVRNVRLADVRGASTSSLVTLPTPPTNTAPTTTAPRTTTAPPTTTAPTTIAPTTTTIAPGPHAELQQTIDDALDGLTFLPDDLDEPSDESKAALDVVAQLLNEHPDLMVEVIGHVAATSDSAADQELSLARAWAVAGYLEWRGVSFDRMDVSGVGGTDPLGADESDNITNDRIEIRIVEGA
ncbi:MAG: OmpA family protein [Actinomycetota bacterium]|nr:OmpA family protein [Actinomycetota bacterium]